MERVAGIVLDGGGAAGLRTSKNHGGAAFVVHPEDVAGSSVPCAAVAVDHPDACRPAEKIVRFVGSFCIRFWPLPADFHHSFAAQEVP